MKRLASVLVMLHNPLVQALSVAVSGFLTMLFHVILTRQGQEGMPLVHLRLRQCRSTPVDQQTQQVLVQC
jgi:hypothetical protein